MANRLCYVGDSRAPHYNCPPTGNQNRMCVYTCYAPVATATEEELIKKKEIFESECCELFGENAC